MSCEDVKSALDAYLEGELDAVRTHDIECHLESCPDCRAAAQRRTKLKQTLLTWAVPPVPEDLAARIVAEATSGVKVRPQTEIQLGSDRPRSPRSWTTGSLPSLAAAAMVVIGLAMGSAMSLRTWSEFDLHAVPSGSEVANDSSQAYGLGDGTDLSLVNAYYALGSDGNESGT